MDARGDYQAAAMSWDIANAARQRQAAGTAQLHPMAQANELIELFPRGTGGHHAGLRDERRQPVLIVGMPRSGTTLTEQILGAHPAVHGCGELPDLALIARHLPLQHGLVEAWPRFWPRLPAGWQPSARERYRRAMLRNSLPGQTRFVDKAPMNYLLLGLAAEILPDARVIWCRRDPRDIAISIYGENFALGEGFATSLESIGHAINAQHMLMRHWQETSSLPILELDYEVLVADLEGQSRRLVDFLGLPWDPACLAFHQRSLGVQTPSRWQVRQPVHTRSVGRWRNYDFALQPLLQVLRPETYPES
jgi:hypothetical protein